MKCINCGAAVSDNAKFCSRCGVKIQEHPSESDKLVEASIKGSADRSVQEKPQKIHATSCVEKSTYSKSSLDNNAKSKFRKFWDNLSVFGKFSVVSVVVAVLLCVVAFLAGRTFAGIISVFWMVVILVALLMKKDVIKAPKTWMPLVAVILSFVLIVPYLSLFNFNVADTERYNRDETDSTDMISVSESLYGEVESDTESSDVDVNTSIEMTTGNDFDRIEKNGFDSATNEVYMLADYVVEIPEYWKSENEIDGGFQRYAETGSKTAMLQVSAQAETDDSYPVTFDGLMDDNDNMIEALESTVFESVTDFEVIDTGVIKGILYKGPIMEKAIGLTGYGEWFIFASEKDRTWCTLVLGQTDNTEYTYTEDFMKIIKSIRSIEDTIPERLPAETAEIPDDWIYLLEKHYEEVEKKFKDAGFTNITCMAHEIDYNEDNVFEGSVVNIAIGENGETCIFEKGEQWPKDVKIRIDYRVKPAKPKSQYERAFIRDMNDYDLYYMFDTDTKTVVYFGTNDTYIETGTYTGDFSEGVTITWSHGEWTEKFTYKSGNTATLIDGSGWDWEYKLCDAEKAQAVLDSLR